MKVACGYTTTLDKEMQRLGRKCRQCFLSGEESLFFKESHGPSSSSLKVLPLSYRLPKNVKRSEADKADCLSIPPSGAGSQISIPPIHSTAALSTTEMNC